MAGVLEDERDPLDFLADFPTPLTSSQREDLAWHRAKLEANRTHMKKIVATFVSRRQHTERFVTEAEGKLSLHLLGGVAPPAAASSTSAAAAPKRGRDEDASADPRAAAESTANAAVPAAAAAPSVESAVPAPVATAPAAPPRRKFGGAFGGLLGGLLADVKKDTSKDDALRKQREEMSRKAEEDRIRGDISLGKGELSDIDERIAILNEKVGNISQQYEDLSAVLADMDTEETRYAASFFLTTKGCTATCGYEISFRPAQMPPSVREIIGHQVDKALDGYLAFRDRTDPFLVEIAESRARKALQREQQLQEEESNRNNGGVGAGGGDVGVGVDHRVGMLVGNDACGADVGGSGLLPMMGSSSSVSSPSNAAAVGGASSSSAVGILGSGGLGILGSGAVGSGIPSNDELMMLVMGGGAGGEGDAADDLNNLDDDQGNAAGGLGAPVEEDLDRYDY